MPLLADSEQAIAALDTFKTVPAGYARRMAANSVAAAGEEAGPLLDALLQLMAADRVDHTIFWRRLSHWTREGRTDDTSVRDLFLNREAIDAWLYHIQSCLCRSTGLAADLM